MAYSVTVGTGNASSMYPPSSITTVAPSGDWLVGSVVGVYCADCGVFFGQSIGGDAARSSDEAVVGAYAMGWYVGRVRICPECCKLIADNIQNAPKIQTNVK